MTALVGSNAVLDRLRARPGLFIVKTMTPDGVMFSWSDGSKPVPRADVCERLIEKGRLVPREASGQGWELAEGWR